MTSRSTCTGFQQQILETCQAVEGSRACLGAGAQSPAGFKTHQHAFGPAVLQGPLPDHPAIRFPAEFISMHLVLVCLQVPLRTSGVTVPLWSSPCCWLSACSTGCGRSRSARYGCQRGTWSCVLSWFAHSTCSTPGLAMSVTPVLCKSALQDSVSWVACISMDTLSNKHPISIMVVTPPAPRCLSTHALHALPLHLQTRKLSELVAAYCREVLKSTAPHLINRLKVGACTLLDGNHMARLP
jgi:hypothetical protein